MSWRDQRRQEITYWKDVTKSWTDDELRDAIKLATSYRSGEDSCNTVYMGSLALNSLNVEIGGKGTFEERLNSAPRERLIKGFVENCAGIWDYAVKNPRYKCPCCGQITKTYYPEWPKS